MKRGILQFVLWAIEALCGCKASWKYPPFARDGNLIVPYWHQHRVGDRVYDISWDVFRRCTRDHVTLEARQEERSWLLSRFLLNYGASPKQLGFVGGDFPGQMWISEERDHIRWVEGFGWKE